MSFAGAGGEGLELVSSSRQMQESTGSDVSTRDDHRPRGALPVDENRETSPGWTAEENMSRGLCFVLAGRFVLHNEEDTKAGAER